MSAALPSIAALEQMRMRALEQLAFADSQNKDTWLTTKESVAWEKKQHQLRVNKINTGINEMVQALVEGRVSSLDEAFDQFAEYTSLRSSHFESGPDEPPFTGQTFRQLLEVRGSVNVETLSAVSRISDEHERERSLLAYTKGLRKDYASLAGFPAYTVMMNLQALMTSSDPTIKAEAAEIYHVASGEGSFTGMSDAGFAGLMREGGNATVPMVLAMTVAGPVGAYVEGTAATAEMTSAGRVIWTGTNAAGRAGWAARGVGFGAEATVFWAANDAFHATLIGDGDYFTAHGLASSFLMLGGLKVLGGAWQLTGGIYLTEAARAAPELRIALSAANHTGAFATEVSGFWGLGQMEQIIGLIPPQDTTLRQELFEAGISLVQIKLAVAAGQAVTGDMMTLQVLTIKLESAKARLERNPEAMGEIVQLEIALDQIQNPGVAQKLIVADPKHARPIIGPNEKTADGWDESPSPPNGDKAGDPPALKPEIREGVVNSVLGILSDDVRGEAFRNLSVTLTRNGFTQNERIALAKKMAAQNGLVTSRYIKSFGVEGQTNVVAIAQIAAAQDGQSTSQLIKNYGITNQASLVSIAEIAAAQDGRGASQHIKNYGITNQASLVSIAEIAAAQNGWGTSEGIRNYGITNQASLVSIAKIAAAQDGWGASYYYQNYGITDQASSIEIAKIAASQNGRGTSISLENYILPGSSPAIETSLRLCCAAQATVEAVEGLPRGFDALKSFVQTLSATGQSLLPPQYVDPCFDRVRRTQTALKIYAYLVDHQSEFTSDEIHSEEVIFHILGLPEGDAVPRLAKIRSNTISDFYDVVLDLGLNFKVAGVFRDFGVDADLFKEAGFKKLSTAMGLMRDVLALQNPGDRNVTLLLERTGLRRGEKLNAKNIDSVITALKSEVVSQIQKLFPSSAERHLTYDQLEQLQSHWGNLEPIYTLLARFSSQPQWNGEIAKLGGVLQAVLAGKFDELKFKGDPNNPEDVQMAADQLQGLDAVGKKAWAKTRTRIAAVDDRKGAQAIAFTILSHDPFLLLTIGNVVNMSSCQNYKTGSHIQTLLGNVVDANVQTLVSFAVQQNDFNTPREFNAVFFRLQSNLPTTAKFDEARRNWTFSWPDEKGLTTTIKTKDVSYGYLRRMVKYGTNDGQPSIGVEQSYSQDHSARAVMESQQAELFAELAAETHAQTDGPMSIARSRNPGGVYSDASNGVQTEAYIIQEPERLQVSEENQTRSQPGL